MIRHPVCRYYAKALIQTASGVEEASTFQQHLQECRALFRENPKLQSVLTSSWVGFKDKEKILNDLSSKLNLDDRIKRFIRILIKNKRMDQFDSILDVYGEMLDRMLNIKTVDIVSPSELSPDDITYVRSKLTEISGMEIKVNSTVDPELLGGMKLILDGKVYDNSIFSKLYSIKKSFLEA